MGNTGNRGNVIFQEMSPNIPGIVVKNSGECCQTFWRMSSNIPGMSSNIPGSVAKHSGECRQIFRGMSPNIPGSVVKIPGDVAKHLRNIIKDSPECPQWVGFQIQR